MNDDARYMALALDLAKGQAGRTGDNPSVGCVLVKDGLIIGQGVTGDGGRPHGEIRALEATESAAGATAYVTLEPCSHYGRSGPCVEALIAAKIARCVIAVIDPNPQVNWQGAARLQEAGIDTLIGPGEAQARTIMTEFFSRFA